MDRSQVLGQGRPQDESNGPFKAARTIGCIYLSVSIPLRITFLPDFQIGANPYSILDLLSTILFMMDAVRGYRRRRTLWFGTTKVSPIQAMNAIYSSVRAGSIFRDAVPAPARLHRPIAWFIPSLAACFPLEYITLMNPDDTGGLSNYLMLNRILIIICLPRYIEDLADFLEVHGLKNIGVQRAWKLFFAMAIAGHWCCCGFFLIAKIEAAKGGDLTWIESLDLIQVIVEEAGSAYGAEGSTTILIEDPVNAYIQSLYWAYITMVRIRNLRGIDCTFACILTSFHTNNTHLYCTVDYNRIWGYNAIGCSRNGLVHLDYDSRGRNHDMRNCKPPIVSNKRRCGICRTPT